MHFWRHFDFILASFWVHFWLIFRLTFSSQFRCVFLWILGAFWESSAFIFAIPSMRNQGFWISTKSQIPSNNEQKCDQKWYENEAQIVHKSIEKSIKKWVGFWSRKWSQNGSQNEARGCQEATKNETRKGSEKTLKIREASPAGSRRNTGRFRPGGGGSP